VAGSPWNYGSEFGWSLAIGSLAATSAVLMGVLLAWLARRGRAAFVLLAGLAACLAIPGPLLGVGIIWAFNRPELPWLADLYDYSILAPWAALTLRALPLASLMLWHALRSVPEETLEAALLDGAGWWTRLLLIALPQRWAALLLAWLVAFAVTLADLAASILVVPPGVMTLPIQIFSKLHYGQEDDVAGICLALILLFALLAASIAWIGRRGLSGRR
jgi:iron(III) transport system permease protein